MYRACFIFVFGIIGLYSVYAEDPTGKHVTCQQFSNITIRSLEYYLFERIDVMGHDRDNLQEILQYMLGIDVFDRAQIKDMSCKLLKAKSTTDLVNMIGPYYQNMDVEQLQGMLEWKVQEIDMIIDGSWTSIVEQSMAKGWMTITGFPKFPLDISFSQALRSVNNLDKSVADRLGIRPTQYISWDGTSHVDMIAKALVESQSIEEYTRSVGEHLSSLKSMLGWISVLDEQIEGVQTYQEFLRMCRAAGLLTLPLQ